MFRNHKILAAESHELTFESSGTTGFDTSRHYVHDIGLYEESFTAGFRNFYDNISDYTLLALLPSYLERKNSSLVYMVERLIRDTEKLESGFYLNDFDKLFESLIELKNKKKKTILIGVSFALLDFVQQHSLDFPELIVMETGGMKGRRKEIIRTELHSLLKAGFGVETIHSEY